MICLGGSPLAYMPRLTVDATRPYLFTTCWAAARAVEVLKQGDVFGFSVWKSKASEAPLIQTILLIGLFDVTG